MTLDRPWVIIMDLFIGLRWKGKPEILLSQHQEGPKRGVWTIPVILERNEDGEREAVSLGLLKQTDLPINPSRFVEISSKRLLPPASLGFRLRTPGIPSRGDVVAVGGGFVFDTNALHRGVTFGALK